jgi:hypothetical protein
MLGGDPEKGEAMFVKAINKYPNNLLIRITYILNSIVPSMDLEKYEKEAAIMRREIAEWEDINRDSLESVSPYKNHDELNLYNAIAKKRFLAVEKYKSTIFE